jgi:DNA gyrase/topoisomerase IV subunit A
MKKNINIEKWEMGKAIKSYYMPYAMKTIVDRALPDVRDGFKPIHRRILYKMFEMGIISIKERAKSVSIVGDVLEIHGHGDVSVYDALAKLTEQCESQLHPYIDGEGAFGKQYSTDKPSAMRYTFARLNSFTENELMKDLNKGVVKFIGEKGHSQPLVLPNTYPNILVKQNEGIAVGMACNFPSFNLKEVCDGTIAYIKNPNVDLSDYLKAPDFSSGGELIYDEKEIKKIINEGKGKLKLRSKYRYDKESNCIEVYQIPYNTTANAIVAQISDIIKNGQFKDILDVREETGFNKETEREELLIAIDVKKNTDINKVMAYLFKNTNLEKAFSANMNCLVDYRPQVLGVKEILDNWLKFRRECIVNVVNFDLERKQKELHILKGLEKILLDIDKTIEIIRFSKKKDVIQKLSDYFKIDEIQVNSVLKMELGNINEEYIIKKIKDIKGLENEIENLKKYTLDEKAINKDIAKQLREVSDKYGKPRMTEIIYETEQQSIAVTEDIPNYNVMFFYTKEGYLKKIPLTSLRSSGEHKLKDGDEIIKVVQGQNTDEILVFTNIGNVYRLKAHKIEDGKTSNLGLYLPTELSLKGEKIVNIVVTSYADGESVLNFYKNGFIARVNIKAYQSNYAMLKGNLESEIIKTEKIVDDIDVMMITTEGKGLIFNTNEINTINSRNAKGVKGITLNGDIVVTNVILNPEDKMQLAITTSKKGTFNDKSSDCVYYKGSRGNVGVFLYNTRKTQDKVIKVEVL